MAQKIKAVIFDLDDTLFDRSMAQVKVAELIPQRFPQLFRGFETSRVVSAFLESDRLSAADFEAQRPGDFGSREIRNIRTRYFLDILGIKEDSLDPITDLYLQELSTLNVPIAGAALLVKRLSAKFPLGVITNGLPDVQYAKLEAIGVRDVLSCIVLSEEIGIRKPDPRIFHYAADALRKQPSECLYVGDSYRNDVIGAKTAGMQACWYNPQSAEPPDSNVRADFVVNKISALAKILEISLNP